MVKYCFCVNCGARIPDTQVSSTCSMCDGDIDHEKDQLEQNRRRIEVEITKEWLMKKICEFYHCSDGWDNQYPSCDMYDKLKCEGGRLYRSITEWFGVYPKED